MKSDNASLHYQQLTRGLALRNPPSRSKGFLLHPTFFLLRVFYRLLIFLIIIIGLSSYWLPLISGYKQLIETEASSYLGTQVKIGSIIYDLNSENPRWVLKNVSLKDYEDQNKILNIKELSMTLDMAESLRTIRVQPDKIQASGVDVTVTQNENSKFHIDGLKLPIAGFTSGAGRQKPLYVDVKDGTAHWINTTDGKQLDLYDLEFHGEIASNRITANIRAIPPESVGKPLEITADLVPDSSLSQQQQTKSKYWTGNIKLKGEINDPSALPVNIQKFTGIIDGNLAFKIDAKVKNNRPVKLKGELIVDHPVLEQALHATQKIEDIYHQDLQQLAIAGEWEAGDDAWKAEFSLEIEQDDSKQISNLSFDHQTTMAGFKLDAKVDQINLNRYLPLLERQQWLNRKIGKYLTQLKPRGELINFSLFLDVDTSNALNTELRGKGVMKDVSIQAHEKIPSLEKITAQFDFDKNSGAIKISSENSQVDYKRWFEAPIKIKKLDASLHWKKTDKQWDFSLKNLAFNNADAHLTGAGTLQLNQNNTPFIDLTLSFGGNRKIQGIKNYVPSFMPDGGEKWLKRSIKSGFVPKGGLILKGNLKKFPFSQGDGGEFFTWFDVDDGRLAYLDNWPEAHNISGKVIFANEGMTAEIKSATVSGNKIISGHIAIPDFKNDAQLNITKLKTTGKLSQQINYIRQSPLGNGIKSFLGSSQFTGKSDLEIAIHTPLTKNKLKKENISVKGTVSFRKISANFTSVKQHFKNIQGQANFDQHGFSAKRLTAQYKQAPITVAITTAKNKKSITATFNQINDIQRLANDTIDILKPYLKGETAYTATLQLPSYSLRNTSKEKAINLIVKSNLKGISSILPAPFNKSDKALIPLNISLMIPMKKNQISTYHIKYGNSLSAIYQYDKHRLGLALGGGEAQLPTSGISIKGNIPTANLIAWKNIIGLQGGASKTPQLINIDLQINKLFLGAQLQGKADLKVKSTHHKLTGNLNSVRLKAHIVKENNFWNIKLSNLNTDVLSNNKKANKAQTLMPKHIPSLHLRCDNCSSKGQKFDHFTLKLANNGNTSLVNLLDISGKDFQFSATGNWKSTGSNSSSSYTQLKIKNAALDKPGDFLKRMGNDVGLENGKTKITGQLGWQGSPMDFSLATLTGDVHLNMQKGQLADVDAGAGKLLGLLNFSKLGKRLRFDFSDVSAKGILFDQITGDLQFNNGVLSTQNTVIESSIMLAGIRGESDLVQNTHDQTIIVIPDVKSALPAISLLFGGVGLGVVVATLDKLSDKNQADQLNDEALGTRYHVTGPWSKPIIEDVTPVGAPEDIYSDI